MRGITLLEPWASMMAWGYKHMETRSWSTEYRGDIVIHASASNKACRITHEVEKKWTDAGVDWPERWPLKAQEYPLGKILAVGRLIDVAEMDEAMVNRVSRMERALGDWRPGRFAWIITSVRRVEQLPWKGALGLWKVPTELEAKLAA